MKTLASMCVALVALAHLGFMILEMFFWTHPVGYKVFSMTPEVAAASKVLAMNQGLYNGFLAAGLLWGLISKQINVIVFFLSCVIIAGIFGAITAKLSILFIQGLPALISLLLMLYLNRR